MTAVRKFQVIIPDVKGADLLYPSPETAAREVAAARKAGLTATMAEVLVRPRRQPAMAWS